MAGDPDAEVGIEHFLSLTPGVSGRATLHSLHREHLLARSSARQS